MEEAKKFRAAKDQLKDDLRQTILEHARSLLIEEGIQQFSMRKLAKAAECSPGTLYVYFKNREQILGQLVEDAFDELRRELTAIERSASDPLRTLRDLLYAYAMFGLNNRDHYQFAFMIQRPDREGSYRPHKSFDVLVEAVEACVAAREFSSSDARLISQSLWVGMHGLTSALIMLPRFPWGHQPAFIRHHIEVLIRGHQGEQS